MELHDVFARSLAHVKKSLVACFVFSLIANLLNLVPIFFMLNVYDKAVGSSSMLTLWSLSIFVAVMFFILFVMEALRSRLLVGISAEFDRIAAPELFHRTFLNAVNVGGLRASVQPLQDLLSLRQFITGNGIFAVFDAPWLPVYLIVLFAFNPLLGFIGVAAALVLVVLGLLNQKQAASSMEAANKKNTDNLARTHRSLKNAEVVAAMGMLPYLQKSWRNQQDEVLIYQTKASSVSGVFTAATKTIRLATQSVAIAAGAYLVIRQEISPGMLIGGSLLVTRALQPVEVAVGSWKGFIDSKLNYERIAALLNSIDLPAPKMALPEIKGKLEVANAVLVPPGNAKPIITNASFTLEPGEVACVVGPSGSGKSTLVRGLLGLWPLASGHIRLDGAEAHLYPRENLGPQIGYLPQDIELLEGSISLNISRFGEIDSGAVVAAAKAAGIHELILTMSNGYDTEVDRPGGMLSPGQRQRIGLARAIYRMPKLVILDEPNSNLDDDGERALERVLVSLKASGSTVILVTHRTSILPYTDKMVLLHQGRVVKVGPTREVAREIAKHQGLTK